VSRTGPVAGLPYRIRLTLALGQRCDADSSGPGDPPAHLATVEEHGRIVDRLGVGVGKARVPAAPNELAEPVELLRARRIRIVSLALVPIPTELDELSQPALQRARRPQQEWLERRIPGAVGAENIAQPPDQDLVEPQLSATRYLAQNAATSPVSANCSTAWRSRPRKPARSAAMILKPGSSDS